MRTTALAFLILAFSASAQTSPPQSNINIENWTKPQSGWLYVLDPRPEAATPGGRVWLIDPEAGKIMGSLRTGEHPDFALSPDGSRLYVASVVDANSSEMAVIDTAQGVVLKSGSVGGRWVADGLPAFSTMAVSGDGSVLRILIDDPKSADQDALLLAGFDTQSGEFLPGVVHVGNCGPGRFISYPNAGHFDFWCPRTNRVRLIEVDADSREQRNQDIKLPWERRIGVGEAIEPADSAAIAIIRGDGGVAEMNVATTEFSETPAHPVASNRIPPAAWPVSPDGSRVYLGYRSDFEKSYDNHFYLEYGRSPNERPANAFAQEFRVYDAHSWRKLGTIRTKMDFWSAAISADGKTLYALAPQKRSILVIDTARMHEVRAFKVGGTPTLAVVAP